MLSQACPFIYEASDYGSHKDTPMHFSNIWKIAVTRIATSKKIVTS